LRKVLVEANACDMKLYHVMVEMFEKEIEIVNSNYFEV